MSLLLCPCQTRVGWLALLLPWTSVAAGCRYQALCTVHERNDLRTMPLAPPDLARPAPLALKMSLTADPLLGVLGSGRGRTSKGACPAGPIHRVGHG